MKQPKLTILQICILNLMGGSQVKGAELRDLLERNDNPLSIPGFSSVMLRLEKAGLVTGSYVTTQVNGHTIREKYFEVTSEGEKALSEAQDYIVKFAL